MRLSVAGLWQGRACTVEWDDGEVTTQPPELLPLVRLHAWIRREGLDTEGTERDDDSRSRGLADASTVLAIARTLFDVILIVEDPLGVWTLDEKPVRSSA